MWKWDHKEDWAQKNYAFELWRFLRAPWTARRSKLSILKEMNSEYALEGLMLKLQYFSHLMRRADSLEKTLDAGEDWRQKEKGAAEDEMFSYHQQLSGLECKQTPEDNEGQWDSCAAFHGVSRSWTWLSDWIITKMLWEEGRGRN